MVAKTATFVALDITLRILRHGLVKSLRLKRVPTLCIALDICVEGGRH